MKRTYSIIVGVFIVNLSWGQIDNFQSGVSISHLSYKVKDMCMCPGEQYRKDLIGYSEFVGMDYFDKKYVDISANLGVISKGGTDPYYDYSNKKFSQILNYASINTIVNFKYPIADKLIPYVNIGPSTDILFYNNQYHNIFPTNSYYYFHRITFTFLFGGGLKYEFNKYQIGFLYERYANVLKIAHIPSYDVFVTASTINLTVGYKLK